MQLFPAASQLDRTRRPQAFGAVAVGGTVGAAARWAVGLSGGQSLGDWPWPTLLVNVVGCLLIGVAAVRVERGSIGWDFGVTGVLGGFTTMSTFAVELNAMVDHNRVGLAVAYCATTVVTAIGAVIVAQALTRRTVGTSNSASETEQRIDDVR